MLDINRLNEWFDSEEGKRSLESYANSLIQERKLKDIQLEKFHAKFASEEKFKAFVEVVIQKYRSDDYYNRWFKRGIEPPNSLFWFLFEYSEKYGRECTQDEWKKHSNPFTADLFYVNGYYFNLMHGQGSFIKITNN